MLLKDGRLPPDDYLVKELKVASHGRTYPLFCEGAKCVPYKEIKNLAANLCPALMVENVYRTVEV